ncbi:MAG: VOC family protein, partial [Nocardioidaceae bacterium]
MRLEGIHHITAITGDAPRNVDFYARVLGLRLVKKTVNQDDPTVYHLFYADEGGSPGSDITFFEYPGLPTGRAGDGMVHRVLWRVGSEAALDFWAERLTGEGVEALREDGGLRFADPDGLDHELLVADVEDEPLIADHPAVPAELALQGFHGVRAYLGQPDRSRTLLEQGLAFEPRADGWEARGERRGGLYLAAAPPAPPARPGAGTGPHGGGSGGIVEHQ